MSRGKVMTPVPQPFPPESADGMVSFADYNFPDERGHFGVFGGRFVAETLTHALDDLDRVYRALKADPDFQRRIDRDLAEFVGRPSPL